MQITMLVNGTEYSREVEARLLLIHFLRDSLGLTGSHWGCDTSNCGACVVWLDDTPVKSCTVLAAMADGHRVLTVEGLERGGELDPVQRGFAECHGLQCGFCTPGMMLTARWLLNNNPDPSVAQIREALSGQICRCTGYENIVRSVRWAAEHEAAGRVPGTGPDGAGHDSPGPDGAGHDSPGPDGAGHDSPGPDGAGHDSPGHDSPGPDGAGHDSPGPDGAGHDGAGHDSADRDMASTARETPA